MNQGPPTPPTSRIDLDAAARLLDAIAEPDPDTPPTDAPPGYSITETLGRGAAGEVFLASHLGSDRPVALKLMHRAVSDSAATRRVWRELDLLGQLRSPQTPLVVDYGLHKGRLFIATEFVEGKPLTEHLSAPAHSEPSRLTPATRRDRARLLARICDAVGEFHDAGIIHRDLKPANIMVTPKGSPVILDFGIAALVSSTPAETLTADGAPIGTPAFMAPEQARGERHRVGIRSDIYALGATAFQLLTGRTPHDLDGVSLYEAIRRVGSLPPRNPRDLDQSMPRPLAAVLSKACAADPADRYASAPELAADLRRWLDHRPVDAQNPGPWIRATRWLASHPVAATAAACGTILAATAAGVLGLLAYIDHAALRPVGIDHNNAKTEIWTISATGRRIRTVYSNTEGIRADCFRFSTPHTELGWAIALTAPDLRVENQSLLRRLSARDPEDPGRVLWKPEEPGDYPPLRFPAYSSAEHRKNHYASVSETIAADVFPQVPGDELISFVTGSPAFPSVLRVYSAQGHQLYRIWIPGHQHIFWLESRHAIVVAGANNRLQTPARTEADFHAGDPPGFHPQTIALIKPVLNQINNRWLTHRIPGSSTNAEDCRVLVQPASHEDGYAEADGPTPNLIIGKISQPPAYATTDHMLIFLAGLANKDANPIGHCNVIFDDAFRIKSTVFSDAFVTHPTFEPLLREWQTPRFRFEHCPPFDPNP